MENHMSATNLKRARRVILLLAVVTMGAILYSVFQPMVALNRRDSDIRVARMKSIRTRLETQRRDMPQILHILERTQSEESHLMLDAVADCITTERIGRRGDGGKWLCNPTELKRPCLVYGVGVGDDISFDREMASRFGCEVHLFDPTPSVVKRFGDLKQGQRLGEGSICFHPWGLGPVSGDPAKARELNIEGSACEVKTLDEIATALGHTKIDVLKIDIEGGELTVLPDMLKRSLFAKLQIAQLLVEFHAFEKGDFPKIANLVVELEAAGLLLHRKELNPYDASQCAEYAFARQDFLLD
jgi:FkbM family methyltransferase